MAVDLFPPPHPALNRGGEQIVVEVYACDPLYRGVAVTEPPADHAVFHGFVADVLRPAAAVPLVVAGCDARLHPWQARLRDALPAARPDAVRMFTGLPGPGAGPDVLCAHRRGRANLRAAAEVLTGVRDAAAR